ncbi:MAG: hypothetical protein KDD44_07000, partial [Bdellovibrionales bacterium]|nr:hypothetical protein [Bdellovibrionales bacterium]
MCAVPHVSLGEPAVGCGLPKKSDAAGSGTLSSVFSILAGLVVAGLFVNVTRYVGGTAAVEQAARRAARCLTPSDPDCVSYSAEFPPLEKNWFQKRYTAVPVETAGTYNYTAEFTQLAFNATYPTYLVHVVTPTLSWDSSSVPLKAFTAEVNQHEVVEARVHGCAVRSTASGAAPVNALGGGAFQPFFPHWRLAREVAVANGASPDYQPYCRANAAGQCCFDPNAGGCDNQVGLTLPPPGTELVQDFVPKNPQGQSTGPGVILASWAGQYFTSPPVTLPPLAPGIAGGMNCQDSFGNSCDVVLQNSTGGTQPWSAQARIAFRVTAEVCPLTPGQTTGVAFSASDIPNDDDAVKLQVGSGGWQGYGRGLSGWSEFSSCKWHAILLRGVHSDDDGTEPEGTKSFGNITADWGDTVRVRVRLRGGENGVEVRSIRYQFWWTDYQAASEPPTCVACEGSYQQIPPLVPAEGPPTPTECDPQQFPASEGWTWAAPAFQPIAYELESLGGDLTSVTPACAATAETFPASLRPSASISSVSCEQTAAVCDLGFSLDSALLAACEPLPPASARTYCGWDSGAVLGGATVGAMPPGSCPASTPGHETTVLAPALWQPDAAYGDPMAMPEVTALNESIAELNQNQPAGAPTFPLLTESNLAWGEQEIVGVSLHPTHPESASTSPQAFDFS